ncbi:hypothetical protein CRM22_002144 [Opisthorchis felineus]|uniref:Secreted protein n=1 Tax=Opisthorchis felineus TaxID=147828 RepID=A0A4S2M7S0_OPIFE|nr:hypothetical protein CRM22_002144 [Opisthorchis felineus]
MRLFLLIHLVIYSHSYFHSIGARNSRSFSMLFLGKFCCHLVLDHMEYLRYGLSQAGTCNCNLFSTDISSTPQTPTVTCRFLLGANVATSLCVHSNTPDLFQRNLCDNLHICGGLAQTCLQNLHLFVVCVNVHHTGLGTSGYSNIGDLENKKEITFLCKPKNHSTYR